MKQKIFLITTLCIPFLMLEALFLILPVCYPPYILAVNEKRPVASYQKNTNYLWSKGWDFNIVTRKHTNNFGYVNDYDYVQDGKIPLMVIIGDSYVEAHQVSNDKSMHGILGEKVKNTGRVYSLGLSGASLSQYLVFAEYAKDEFSADSLVFIVVGNDFDQSLRRYKSAPRFHYFEEKDGRYVLKRIDFEIGLLKKFLRRSALVRYIMLNLEVRSIIEPPVIKSKDKSIRFVGNVPRDVSDQRLRDSKSAVDEFFRQLPVKSGIEVKKILFMLDGMRPSLYSEYGLADAKDSYFDQMRSYFVMIANELGYEVKDMQPVFIKRNRYDGSTFEFPSDAHWNELAHNLVASEIASSQVYERTFQKH